MSSDNKNISFLNNYKCKVTEWRKNLKLISDCRDWILLTSQYPFFSCIFVHISLKDLSRYKVCSSKHLGRITTDILWLFLPQILQSSHVISNTLHEAEIRVLCGLCHHLQNPLLLFMLKTDVNKDVCMCWIIVQLQNKHGSNQTPYSKSC